MLRGVTLLLLTAATTSVAFGADQIAPGHPPVRYKHNPQVIYGPPVVPPPVVVYRDPDVLFTPSGPYIPLLPHTPVLPGSAALPGYYGSSHSYDYRGPYYGGPGEVGIWNRLPYACGVYGYC
jgi:hypothetical protein